jgi:transposase-like protein
VLCRLKAAWEEEFERWQQRDLSARRYVYIWADGVYLKPGWKSKNNASWF